MIITRHYKILLSRHNKFYYENLICSYENISTGEVRNTTPCTACYKLVTLMINLTTFECQTLSPKTHVLSSVCKSKLWVSLSLSSVGVSGAVICKLHFSIQPYIVREMRRLHRSLRTACFVAIKGMIICLGYYVGFF